MRGGGDPFRGVREAFARVNYNAAPTQLLPVYRIDRERGPEIAALRWGLIPSWAKDAAIGSKMINARGDTVAEKPSFRSAFKRNRCLVLMSGFYEWKGVAGKKVPHFIHLLNQPTMACAGLYEWWRPKDGDPIESFTIITTEPNELMATIHNRMPVILPAERYDTWLDPKAEPEAVKALLTSYPAEEMRAYPVSTAVNSVKNNRADLIASVAE